MRHLRMVNLVLFLMFVHQGAAVFDPSVCDTPAAPSPTFPRPVLPPTFEVHIDCIIVNKNMSTEIHEFYDQNSNKGELRQTLGGTHFYAYYDYSSNEFLAVYPQQKQCTVSDLSTSDQRFLLGYNTTGLPGGQGRIFTASAALHFGGTMENYQGKDVTRGINVEKWTSCQYWPGMDASMKVTWYFSDPDSWDMALSLDSTPVRAWVKGSIGTSGDTDPHKFEHYYDFIHFKPFIDTDRAFEVPSFVTCPGRILTKPMPPIPPAFSFSIEILDEKGQDVSYMKEWYDDILKVTKYVYTPSITTSDGRFGYRPLTEIHDFNTGVAYVIDNQLGNCTFQKIEESNFDDINKDPFHVRIRTSREFFYMNTSGISYDGVRTTRGIPADVFIAKRSDFPAGSPVNSTFEWYFKTDYYTFVQDKQSTFPGGHPIQMRVSIPQMNGLYTYNMYNYIRAPADIIHWDVSVCYLNLNRRKFMFSVSNIYKSSIASNGNQFKYATLQALAYYAQLNTLRIANLQVTFFDNIQVKFDLLDVAPITGDVLHNVTQTPLGTAASTITNIINSGRLVILLYQGRRQRPVAVTPMQSSLIEIIEGSTRSTTTSTTTSAPTKKPVTQRPQTNWPPTHKPNTNRQTTRHPVTLNPFATPKPNPTPTPRVTPRNPYPGSTSAIGACDNTGSGYSGGVALGVSAVMILIGGAFGTGTALFLMKRKRGHWSRLTES